jgi:ubiquinone/menaquinone biosynthesis C-methylase UbiE
MRLFDELINLIGAKSPLQKKKLERYLSKRDERFWADAEQFAASYFSYLKHENISLEFVVDAYLKMCRDMFRSQVSFMRSGVYPVDSSTQAFKTVYNNEMEMKSYMLGLAVSQYLWDTHYEMYSTFTNYLKKISGNVKSYLEIGPGHGLFLSKAMDILDKDAEIIGVDISPMSVEITKSIISFMHAGTKASFFNADIMEMPIEQKFDFVTMGEVLEHVMHPERLLIKIGELLADNGSAFISTCVDCPAIDHVYHFKSVNEIRDMISQCGLKIITERVLPVEELPMEEIVAQKITINYCAILTKQAI